MAAPLMMYALSNAASLSFSVSRCIFLCLLFCLTHAHRSNDLRAVRPEYKEILLNREVIAVDQDKLGRQGGRVKKDRNFEWWLRPLSDNAYALAIWLRAIDQGWPQQVCSSASVLRCVRSCVAILSDCVVRYR